jgi:glycosyltransferase involved in cell wall biosynthesis
VLASSWVLVNTSARESLPTSFVEAAAHGCAILSGIDPDGFASEFGRCVAGDDYASGLRWLLENGRWRQRGEAGMRYARKVFDLEASIQRHMRIYAGLLGR